VINEKLSDKLRASQDSMIEKNYPNLDPKRGPMRITEILPQVNSIEVANEHISSLIGKVEAINLERYLVRIIKPYTAAAGVEHVAQLVQVSKKLVDLNCRCESCLWTMAKPIVLKIGSTKMNHFRHQTLNGRPTAGSLNIQHPKCFRKLLDTRH
jgi:hypothetical protein